jgi:hypothetical protein
MEMPNSFESICNFPSCLIILSVIALFFFVFDFGSIYFDRGDTHSF